MASRIGCMKATKSLSGFQKLLSMSRMLSFSSLAPSFLASNCDSVTSRTSAAWLAMHHSAAAT